MQGCLAMDIGLPGASGAPVLNAARAAASRKNGARSRGPKTSEGKARSSQNALKHGLRARKWVVLVGESETEFKRLEAALIEELAPDGVLQSLLAQRVAAAAWRLGRAEQIETQLFAENALQGAHRSLGLTFIRDCNGARSLDTLLRYRGGTLAELWRALRTLKALQAEAAQAYMRGVAGAEPAALPERPGEPGGRSNPGASPGTTPVPPPARPAAAAPAAAAPAAVASRLAARTSPSRPDEPKSPGTPYNLGRDSDRTEPNGGPSPAPAWLASVVPTAAESAPYASPVESTPAPWAASAPPSQSAPQKRSAALLAGTALAPPRQSPYRRLD